MNLNEEQKVTLKLIQQTPLFWQVLEPARPRH